MGGLDCEVDIVFFDCIFKLFTSFVEIARI